MFYLLPDLSSLTKLVPSTASLRPVVAAIIARRQTIGVLHYFPDQPEAQDLADLRTSFLLLDRSYNNVSYLGQRTFSKE